MKYRFLLLLFTLLTFYANSQQISKPRGGQTGSWRLLGSVMANHTADHNIIYITGMHDYFRKLKFKVTHSPINMHRMIVRYDDGAPENIDTRLEIPKGGESRLIDLRGGKRKLKSIEFWFDTKGIFNGKAEVTVFGQK